MNPSQSSGRHRIVVEFEDGTYLTKLVHPDAGCVPTNTCSECYADLTNPESTRCDCCPPADECWIQGWFDNTTAEELLRGRIEVVVDAEWDQESCLLRVVDVAMPEKVAR